MPSTETVTSGGRTVAPAPRFCQILGAESFFREPPAHSAIGHHQALRLQVIEKPENDERTRDDHIRALGLEPSHVATCGERKRGELGDDALEFDDEER